MDTTLWRTKGHKDIRHCCVCHLPRAQIFLPASSFLHPHPCILPPLSRPPFLLGPAQALAPPWPWGRLCCPLACAPPSVIFAGRLLPTAEMWSPAAKYTAIHLLFVMVSPTHLALQTKNCVSHLPSLCGGEASLEITCGLK